ncbi:MAG: DMT family transporter [Firmicutes bacterium]|nr:DMT family transporter [Bacillota bacterium]
MDKKSSSGKKYEALLFLVTFFWGTTFVAQSVAMDEIPPFSYVFARFLISAVILLCIALCRDALRKHRNIPRPSYDVRQTVLGGIVTGAALCAASITQQIGLITTTVGEASFITSFYIILVPVLSIFLGIKATRRLWIGVIISLAGLYFISIEQGLHMSIGNAFELLCAVLFSIQILTINYFSKNADLLWYAVIEFFVIAVISLVLSLLFEHATWGQYKAAAIPILYAAVLSGAFCYSMQNVCQKHLDPTVASLIMGTEAVFATFSGFLILHETLSLRKLIGCALVFIAIAIVLTPGKKNGGFA